MKEREEPREKKVRVFKCLYVCVYVRVSVYVCFCTCTYVHNG